MLGFFHKNFVDIPCYCWVLFYLVSFSQLFVLFAPTWVCFAVSCSTSSSFMGSMKRSMSLGRLTRKRNPPKSTEHQHALWVPVLFISVTSPFRLSYYLPCLSFLPFRLPGFFAALICEYFSMHLCVFLVVLVFFGCFNKACSLTDIVLHLGLCF